jgi:hypothetical protein
LKKEKGERIERNLLDKKKRNENSEKKERNRHSDQLTRNLYKHAGVRRGACWEKRKSGTSLHPRRASASAPVEVRKEGRLKRLPPQLLIQMMPSGAR